MATYRKLLKNRDGDIIIPVVDVMGDYSTSEVDTGYHWIDGKTIYKKTVYFSSLPNNTTKTVSFGVNNVSYVIKMEGSAYRANDGAFFTLPNASALAVANAIDMAYLANSKEVQVRTGMDRTNCIAYITVYYTKTS